MSIRSWKLARQRLLVGGLLLAITAATLVSSLLALTPVAAAQPACGDTIASDVTLTADVVCPAGFGGAALEITGNGVTLDGGGFKVTGDSAGIGIKVFSANNVTIQNIEVAKFRYGIQARSPAFNLTVRDSTISSRFGIDAFGSGLTLADNTVTGTGLEGLNAGIGTGHQYTNNTFITSGAQNRVIGATQSTIKDNVFVGAAYGLILQGTSTQSTRFW